MEKFFHGNIHTFPLNDLWMILSAKLYFGRYGLSAHGIYSNIRYVWVERKSAESWKQR